jgi:outer membrane protein, heavy metal efflux system
MSSPVTAQSGRPEVSVARYARAIPAITAMLLAGCATPSVAPVPGAWPAGNSASPASSPMPAGGNLDAGLDAPGLPADATLDDYLGFAVRNSPELAAAYHRWRAAAERVTQARTLPDPQLGLSFVVDQVDASAEYMGERYSISQMFPWFGKLALRGDVALEEAHAEARRYEAVRLELAERVTRAWFELAWLRQAAATARENRDLLLHYDAVARARYRVGAVSQADVNRAQVELGRLDDQATSLQDMTGPASAALNAALGRPAHLPLPGAFGAPSRQPAGVLPELGEEEWLALAREQNPQLAAAAHTIARERQATVLARREYFPDVTLGLEYGRNGSGRMAAMDGGGSDMLAGMVSFSLPIRRNRIAAGVREAEARLGAATRDAQAQGFGIEAELRQALFMHRDSVRRAALYGGTLLPKARHSLESTEAAYRAGEAGFSDLIDAQRVLLEFALAHERAAADRAQALARIRALVGELPSSMPLMPPAGPTGQEARP